MRARFILGFTLVLFLGVVLAALVGGRVSASQRLVNQPTLAPTPTPGAPILIAPTSAPLAQPLTTEEQAIEQVLKVDANIAVWEHPWSKDTLTLEPTRITLQAFPSRTAEEQGGGFAPEIDADAGAVWRVTITGTVQLNLIGMGADWTAKYDGVTYVISQRHGGLLSVYAGKRIQPATP
jgi:hypothetical protein